jgi:hypothetical protein
MTVHDHIPQCMIIPTLHDHLCMTT